MSTFDPDLFLKGQSSQEFDPDAFLGGSDSKGFDPDAFLGSSEPKATEALVPEDITEEDLPFFRPGDAFESVWDAFKGLGITAPAAYYQFKEAGVRPDQYSPAAKAAFAEAKALQEELARKNSLEGATDFGNAFRDVTNSLGFSVGNMAVSIPAFVAGSKTGAAVGALAGAPAAGAGAAPGAAIGGLIGGTTAAFSASATASYRMASTSFMNEAFNAAMDEYKLVNGVDAPEEYRQEIFEKLKPVADSAAKWEAAPEAIMNAMTAGVGSALLTPAKKKIASVLVSEGLTAARAAALTSGKAVGKAAANQTEKELLAKAAQQVGSKFLGTKLGKAALVGLDAVGEFTGETITQIGQNAEQKKADAISKGEDYSDIEADWSPQGIAQAFGEIAPQTAAMMLLLGGTVGAVSSTASAAQRLRAIGAPQTAQTMEAMEATPLEELVPPASKTPGLEGLGEAESVAGAPDSDGVLEKIQIPGFKGSESASIERKAGDSQDLFSRIFGQIPEDMEWSEPQEAGLSLRANPNKADGKPVVWYNHDTQPIATPFVFNKETNSFEPASEETVNAIKAQKRGLMDMSVLLQKKEVVEQQTTKPDVEGIKVTGAAPRVLETGLGNSEGSVQPSALAEPASPPGAEPKSIGKPEAGGVAAVASNVATPNNQAPAGPESNSAPLASVTPLSAERAAELVSLGSQPFPGSDSPASRARFSAIQELKDRGLWDAENKKPSAEAVALATPKVEPAGPESNSAPLASVTLEDASPLAQRYTIEPLDEVGVVQDEIQMADGSTRIVDRDVSIQERSQIVDSSGAVVWTGSNEAAQSALDDLSRKPFPQKSEKNDPLTAPSVASTQPAAIPGNLAEPISESAPLPESLSAPKPASFRERVVSAINSEALSSATKDAVNSIPVVKAAAGEGGVTGLIASALEVGDAQEKAIENLSAIAAHSDSAKKAVVDAVISAGEREASASQKKKNREKAKALAERIGGKLASSPASQPASKETGKGRKHITKEEWASVSGKQSGNQAIVTVVNRSLRLGSVLTVGSQDGRLVDLMYRVVGQRVDKDGNVSHRLERINMVDTSNRNAVSAQLGLFNRFAPGFENVQKSADLLIGSGLNVSDGVRSQIKDAVLEALSTMIGNVSARARLSIDDASPDPMNLDTGTKIITVNTQYYADQLRDRLSNVEGSNTVGIRGIVDDLAAEINQTLLEEVGHSYGVDVLESTNQSREEVEDALDDLRAAPSKTFIEGIQWRLGAQGVGMTEQELLDAYDQLEGLEKRAVFYEMMAMMQARVSTGTTVADTRANAQRWIENLTSGAEPSLFQRIAELANRYFEAIHRFLEGHKEIAALPASSKRLFDRVDEAMRKGGVVAPGKVGLDAVTDLTSELNLMRNIARNQTSMLTVQRDLRDAVEDMRRINPGSNPVTLDSDGNLVLDEDFETKFGERVQPLLDSLNDNIRPELALRFAAVASDLNLVLSQLNGGVPWNAGVTKLYNKETGKYQNEWHAVSDLRGIRKSAVQSILGRLAMSEPLASKALGEAGSEVLIEVGRNDVGDMPAADMEILDRMRATPGGEAVVRAYEKASLEFDRIASTTKESIVPNDKVVRALRMLEEAKNANDAQLAQRLERDLAEMRSTYPSGIAPKDFEALRKKAIDAQEKLGEAMSRIENELDDRGKPTQFAKQIAQYREKRTIALKKHLNDRIAAEEIFRGGTRGISHYITNHSTNPELVERAFRLAFPGNQAAIDSLREASSMINAADRLVGFRQEFEFLVMGGKMPVSMSPTGSNFGTFWRPVNLANPGAQINLTPISTPGLLLSASGSLLASEDILSKQPSASGSMSLPMEFGSVDVVFSDSEGYSQALRSSSNMDSNGNTIVTEEALPIILKVMASEILEGSRGASLMFGIEARSFPKDENGDPLPSSDTNTFIASNARVMATRAVKAMHDGRHANHTPIPREALLSNGFALLETFDEYTGRPQYRFDKNAINLEGAMEVLDFSGENETENALSNLRNGSFASILIESLRFIEKHQPGHRMVLLSHEGGLTPAGISYQAVAPKVVELLALTKNNTLSFYLPKDGAKEVVEVDLQQTLLDSVRSEDDRRLLQRAFSRLANSGTSNGPALENTPGFTKARQDLANFPTSLNSYFFDLIRGVKAANSVYNQSKTIASRYEPSEMFSPNGSFPLELEGMADSRFQIALRQSTLNGDVLESTLVTKPAFKFMSEWARLLSHPHAKQIYDPNLLKGSHRLRFSQDIVGSSSGAVLADPSIGRDDPEAFRHDSVVGGRGATFDQEDLIEWGKLTEDQWLSKMKNLRHQSLMAMLGGDEDKVLEFINSPQFSTRSNGETVWHHELIDSEILDRLEKLDAEERQRGVITVIGEKTFSSVDGSLKALASRVDDRGKAAIESVLSTGGHVEKADQRTPRFPEGVFEGDDFHSDARTMLQTLTRMLPQISIVTGNARSEMSFDGDDGKRRIPSILFINDQSAPTLVMPYGQNVAPTREELQAAMEGMLSWLSEFGGTNLPEIAAPLFAALNSKASRNDGFVNAIETAYRNELRLAEKEWTQKEDANIRNLAKIWNGVVRDGAAIAMQKADAAGAMLPDTPLDRSVILDENDRILTGVKYRLQDLSPKQASSLLASIFVDPFMKKALLLSMDSRPNLDVPSEEKMALRGNLIDATILPGFDSEVLLDQILEASFKSEPLPARPNQVEREMEDEELGNVQHITDDYGNLIGDELDPLDQLSEQGLSPLRDIQEEWANMLLHSVIDRLEVEAFSAAEVARIAPNPEMALGPWATDKEIKEYNDSLPKEFPVGLVPYGLSESAPALSEFQARQLLAVLDKAELEEAIRADSEGIILDYGKTTATVDQLMAVTGEAANWLRSKLSKVVLHDAKNKSSVERLDRHKTWSFTDPLDPTYDGTNWHNGRVRKGMNHAVMRLEKNGDGIVTMVGQTDNGMLKYAMDVNFERLHAAALRADLLKMVDDPKGGGKIDALTLAKREYDEMVAAQQSLMKDMDESADIANRTVRDLEAQIAELEALRPALLAADQIESFKKILDGSSISVDEGSKFTVAPVVNMAFNDAEGLRSAMASAIVGDFDKNADQLINREMTQIRFRHGDPTAREAYDEIDNPISFAFEGIEADAAKADRELAENDASARETHSKNVAKIVKKRDAALAPLYARRDAIPQGLPVPEELQAEIESTQKLYRQMLQLLSNREDLRRTAFAATRRKDVVTSRTHTSTMHDEFGEFSSKELGRISDAMDLINQMQGYIDRLDSEMSLLPDDIDSANEEFGELVNAKISAVKDIERHIKAFENSIKRTERFSNSRIENFMDVDQFSIDQHGAKKATSAYRSFLKKLSSPKHLNALAYNAVARTVVTHFAQRGLDPGVSSMDFTGSIEGAMFDVPKEAMDEITAELVKAKSAASVQARIEKILEKHVLPKESVANSAYFAIRSKIEERLAEATRKQGHSVMEWFEMASQIEYSSALDQHTLHSVVMSAAKDAISAKTKLSEFEARELLTEKLKEQVRWNYRMESMVIGGNGSGPASIVKFVGSPNEMAVAGRWLNAYGTRWSRNYMATEANIDIIDGMLSSADRAERVGQLMDLGADALTMVTGQQHLVVGDFVAEIGLAPDDATLTQQMEEMVKNRKAIADLEIQKLVSEQRLDKAQRKEIEAKIKSAGSEEKALADMLEIPGQPGSGNRLASMKLASNPHVGAVNMPKFISTVDQVGRIMHNFSSFFKSSPDAKAMLGLEHSDPNHMVYSDFRKRLAILLDLDASGVLAGQGAVEQEEGEIYDLFKHAPLDVRVKQLLSDMETGNVHLAAANFHKVSNATQAWIMSKNGIDAIAKGFIPGELFSKPLIHALLNHDPSIGRAFAKSVKAINSAENFIGLLDYGFTGDIGRSSFIASKDAHAIALTKLADKIKGPRQMEDGALGYMYHAVFGYLGNAKNDNYVDRAKAILSGFKQSDHGFQMAEIAMPQLLEGNSLKDYMKAPWNALRMVNHKLTEAPYKVLQNKKLYEAMRDRFTPILQQIIDEDVSDIKRINDIKKEFRAGMSKESKTYGDEVRKLMSNLRNAFITQARLSGRDIKQMEESFEMGFHWNEFGKERSVSAEAPSFMDKVSLEKASWLIGPSRRPKRGQIHMLNVNGFEAIEHQMRDMLYRLNMDPAYGAFRESVGEVKQVEGHYLSATSKGAMERMSEGQPEASRQKAIDASRTIAYLGQEVLRKDANFSMEQNIAIDQFQKLSQLGVASSLISASQIPRQTIPAAIAYSLAYGSGNMSYPFYLMRYSWARIGSRIQRALGGAGDNFSRNVDHMVERYATNAYIRSADGQHNYWENLSRMKLPPDLRAEGRLTGSARPVADALTLAPKEVAYWSMKASDAMLKAVLAKPESFLVRTIWSHEMAKAYNAEFGTNVSVEDLMDPSKKHHMKFSLPMRIQALKAVTDMMAVSDPGKKSKILQAQDTLIAEIARGSITMFSNHLLHIGGNSYKAYSMIRNGDAETKRAGVRLLTTNVGQNVLFQLFKYSFVAYAISKIYGMLTGGDEDDEQRVHGAFYGITPEGGEEERRGHAMHWVATTLGGTSPVGWNKSTSSWQQSKEDKDKKTLALNLSKEVLQQTPFGGIGLMASTAIGSALSSHILNGTVMNLLPGEQSHYERAGFVWPKSLGGDGRGPKSSSGIERMAYSSSQVFINDIASRSTLTGGIETMLDPFVQMSNAKSEADFIDKILLMLSAAPPIPREFRNEMQRPFQESGNAKIWSRSWER